jgi:hypothetical protein
VANFSLLDVVSPYVFAGAAISNPLHDLLSVLFVQDVETAFDDNGVVVSGMARFSVDVNARPIRYTPPAGFSFDATAVADHRTTRRAGAFWDFPDIAIRFRLTAPRTSSPTADLVVNGGPGGTPPPLNNAAVRAVLAGLGQGNPASGTPAADAPNTVFHLDLLVDAATLHLPFLTPAKLGPDGMLVPDPSFREVTVTLPKIKLSFVQTAGTAAVDPLMTVSLDSWAAQDIDDPSGTPYGELIRMTPPYALIGPGAYFGFGFQSVVVDLSGTTTPPELLSKFGVGDDFRGLYLPDTRVFVKLPAMDNLSIDVSARELLIGLGPEGGVSGIFGLDVVLPAKPQSATITVYDAFGQLITRLATPDGGTGPWTAPPVNVPAKTQWVVDATGGQPPYNITVDGTTQTTAPVPVTLPAGTTARNVTIQINDVHTGGQSRTITVPVVLTAPSLAAGTTVASAQPVQQTVVTAGPPGYSISVLDTPAAERTTLVFTPPDPTAATVSGLGPITVTGGRATIDLKHGQQVDVGATWTVPAVPANSPLTVNAQFQYDQPQKVPNQTPEDPDDPAWTAFAANPDNIRTVASNDAGDPHGGWTAPDASLSTSAELAALVASAAADPTRPIKLFGMASKEHVPNQQYNLDLSRRRIWALRELLRAKGITNPLPELPEGEQPPTGGYLQPGRGAYRRVAATLESVGAPASTANAGIHVSRPARPPAPVPVPVKVIQRGVVGSPDLQFKEAHLRVEISHNRLIAIELRLKVDLKTVLESYLSRVQQQNPGQNSPNATLPIGKKADPNDGVLDLRAQLTLDDTVDRWHVLISLFENDPDGFLQTPPPSDPNPDHPALQYWRSFLGTLIAITPLVDASAAANTPAGDLVALGISHAVPFAVVTLGIVKVPRITLYGGEFTLSHDSSGTRGALLLDVEVALVVVVKIGNTKIVDTKPNNPITVRYKAIGFRISDDPQIRDLVPVFDSSKGYTINVPSTGGIVVPDPLGDILQIAGTRIARSNPVNLELDIELKADLGVVSVDRTTIRIPLEGGHAPTVTALGVHIDIPGAIEGHGYLAVYDNGFAGQLDVSLPGIGVRVAAGLSVRHVADPADPARTATAVLLTLEVDFPVPIALGNSGLGIYGFGGLFALHHKRDEHPNDPVPALNWLARVDGNPMKIEGWVPDIDRWSIGVGAVLGTIDAGFTLNVKGALIFEMPGPRILLVMKASLLKLRPNRQGNVTATILAVIDIDLGRGRITIGLSLDYDIYPMLKVHLPVRAIFPFDDLEHFAIDAGSYWNPATVEFFRLFTARGYFMIRGRGIPDAEYDAGHPAPFDPVSGFAIATGASVSFIWGSRSSGLYLSVGAAIDVVLGFAPIRFNGTLRLWGELHLWIIGIEAAARLEVTAGQVDDPANPGATKNIVLIDGEVHGSIDLFFFTLEGSVHVTLGDDPGSPPKPSPLVSGVSLQSRAAALLTGVNSDRPIDGKLVDARAGGSSVPAEEGVPIDSIIVLHLDCTPRIASGAAFTATREDGPVSVGIGPAPGPAAPAVRRGEPYYTYRIKNVTLDHQLTKGEVPIVWWPGQPNPGAEAKRELALLTRVPDPHPSALERSKHQEDGLFHVWGTICDEVVPATSVLWTFHDEPLGPSTVGWVVAPGIPWPDPPDASRSQPVDVRLDVAETWHTGDPGADLMTDIAPARVIGGDVRCDQNCAERRERPAPAAPVGPSAEVAQRYRLPLAVTGSCWARVLEAPFQRLTDFDLVRQHHPLGDVLVRLYDAARAESSDRLDDILAFATGEIVHLRMLLLVPDVVLGSGTLILRTFAANGDALNEFKIGFEATTVVDSVDDLPETWWDPRGPWRCRVAEVMTYLTGADPLKEGYRLVLVDTDVDRRTAYVQTGLTELEMLLNEGLGRPSYLVGVVETLTAAEVERHDFDTSVKHHLLETLNGALEGMPNPPALLRPDTTYQVAVAYEWTTCNADGGGVKDDGWQEETQTFAFRTDDRPLKPRTTKPPGTTKEVEMPVRLDPWVILTDPDEGEHFFFWGHLVRVVFSVDYLLDMFATYDVPLEGRVRAASHANSSGPNFDKTRLALQTANVKPVLGAPVLTPWEGTLRDLVTDAVRPLKCVADFGVTSRQTVIDLNLLLEPRTDYVFDIEPADAPPAPAGGAARPLFRRAFTTSRYHDPQEMCADVRAAAVREFPATAADVTGLEALVTQPGPVAGATLDAALRQAGLRPVLEVTDPEVEVLWVPGVGGLQPRILVLRTPEPLVRARRQPEQYEPPGQPRLGRKVIRLVDKPYLEVVGGAGTHIVSQPGRNTVVVVVDQGRDKPIGLSLREHDNPFLGEGSAVADTELLALHMDAATWEVG